MMIAPGNERPPVAMPGAERMLIAGPRRHGKELEGKLGYLLGTQDR